ncbi:MAG: sulfotransferase, partial [Myxococcota bacterium]
MAAPTFLAHAQDRLRNGDSAGAEQILRDGLVAAPDSVHGWCILADALARRHAYEESLVATAQALAVSPGDPLALISRARTLRALGQRDAALDAFARALGGPDLPPPVRAHGLMEMGRTLDEGGRHEEAWEAVTLGQRIRRSMAAASGLRPHWLSSHLDAMHRWLDVRTPPEPVAYDDPRPLPIFLVGVPRSGTTLTEQILIAAGVQSTEERPALSMAIADVVQANPTLAYPGDLHAWPLSVVAQVRERFFERAGFADDVRVLHKLPLDLVHVGAIHRCFAGAPVVQALRDPRDTLVSGFFQNFLLNPAMLNWTDPRQLALATRGLLELGRRWARDLEGLVLRVQRYDRLTDDPEPEMRALVAHVGLPQMAETPQCGRR